MELMYSSRRDFPLERKTKEAAAFDLYADTLSIKGENFITVTNKKVVNIPTGISLCLPEGTVAIASLRSGFSTRNAVMSPTGVGIIDSDYAGIIHFPLIGLTENDTIVHHGDRIGQITILDLCKCTFQMVDENIKDQYHTAKGSDRTGGFGSTG